MKVANNIEVGAEAAGGIVVDTQVRKGMDDTNGIQALTTPCIFTKDETKGWRFINTLDGSVDADIVVNADDKEALNEDKETKKLLDEEREEKREMYFRQARLLYPEKEEWCLSMAIDAFMYQEEKGIDITKYKFGSFNEPPTPP